MRKVTFRTLVLAVLVSACAPDGEAPAERDPALAPRTDATVDLDSQRLARRSGPLPERPSARRDTLTTGSTADVVDFALVHAPLGFAVPFSTYLPEGMVVEFDTAVAVHRVTLAGEASDSLPEAAFMTITVHAAGTTRLVVEDRVREFVVSRGPGIDESQEVEPPSWGEWAVDLSYPRSVGEWFAGSAVIGQYGPRYFHVIQLYPAEERDAFAARFDAVLEHWRWEDTGLMLTAAGGSTR